MAIFIIQVVGLLVFLVLLTFAWSMIITSLFGPPIVPTPKKIIKEIFSEVKPNRGSLLVDLGSGSGRVLQIAAKIFREQT